MSEKPIAAEEQESPGGPDQGPPAEVREGADDATAEPGATERAGEAVEQDLDALTATQRERDEYLELAQRTKADFDNYRKRVAKEASDAVVRGRAELARDLVPVLDNLERAVDAAADDPLSRGVALVLEELRATLKRAGVEAYDPVGEKFDPAWHEALSTKPSAGEETGTVVETLERGYRLDGQVLRPARVVVSE
jgi:molecular chaperone GrpE